MNQQQMAWAEQQRQEAALQAEVQKHVSTFREAHADEFGQTPEGEKAFGEFLEAYRTNTDVTDFEDAYKILRFDTLQARAREAGRTSVEQAEHEAEQAGTVTPSAHVPDTFEGDPKDREFETARERALQSGIGLEGSLV